MKKLMTIVCAIAAAFVMTSCSGNSPKSVAEKQVKCLADKDYKGYTELMYFDDEKMSKEEIEETQKQVAEVLERKAGPIFEQKGKITGCKATSEEISEDGNEATVELNVKSETKDGKAEEETLTMKLRKNKAGEWKVKQ